MTPLTTESAPVAGVRQAIHWPVVIACFLAVLLDGFDTAALAFTIPTLAKEWGVVAAAFTTPLVLTNIGVVVGYVSAGALGARMRMRTLLIAGVALFAITTIAVALTLPLHSIALLAALRLLTGVGLGIVLPAGVSLATTYSPAHRGEMISVGVTLGLASGATVGGLFGGQLLRTVGTDGVFWVAGVLPLVLAAAMLVLLPRAVAAGADADTKRAAGVARLFDGDLRLSTPLVWLFSFLIFITAYTLQSWVPTLLTGYGFAPTAAPIGLAYLSIGGIIGGLVLLPLAGRIGIVRALILMPLLGAAAMAVVSRVPLADTVLLLALGVVGIGVYASQIGQLALAVALYPVGSRTTGIGWAAALGRLGSIVGPGVAGILLGLALPARDIVLVGVFPILLAVLAMVVLWRLTGVNGSRRPA